jgi:PAS domain S-box-containing protein
MSANVHENRIDNTDYVGNNFYRFVFEDSQIPTILVKDDIIVDLSNSMKTFFSLKNKNELIYKHIDTLTHFIPQFDFEVLSAYFSIDNTYREYSVNLDVTFAGVNKKTIEIRANMILNNQNKYFIIKFFEYNNVIKNYYDILKLININNDEALWDWDLINNKPYFSPRWFTMLEYDVNEFSHNYDNWKKLIHPDDIENAEKILNQYIIDNIVYSVEFRMKTKTGNWLWILSRGRVIQWDENGNSARMIGSHTDISEKKHAEEVNSIYRKQLEETNLALIRSQEQINKKIISLTQPLGDTNDLSIYDLFDVAELQQIQDAFSYATGVGSLITLPDGTPVTKPSNFCQLCNDIIRKTPKGLKNCMLSDAEIGKNSALGPNCKTCLSGGLVDGGAGIMIGDRQIANWLVGQVLDSDIDLSVLMNYADEIGANKEQYALALKDVKRMPKAQFSLITKALYLIAKQMSTLALQNVQQAREITKREKAENALIESEQKFKSAMNQIPGIIWTTDRELIITQILGQGLKHLAFSADEMLGMPLQKFYGTDNPYYYPILLHKTVLDGSSAHYEINFGHSVFSCEVEPLRNFKTEIIGSLGIAIDISDRKIAEDALNDSLKRFKDVTNAAGEFVWETDNYWKFTFVTQKAEDIFGFSRQELLNKKIGDLQFVEDKNSTLNFLTELINFSEEFKNYQSRFVTESGNIIWLNISGTPIYDSLNNLIGYRGTGLDITKEKLAIRERELLIETLEFKNSEMERFTYTVSHDLRSPLITIKGFIGMLLADIKSDRIDRVNDDICRISNAADKMQALLEDLLELSRIGRVVNPPELVDANALINDVMELLKGITDPIEFEIEIAEKMLPIWGDKNRLREVFQNLIENAVKFRNPEQKLKLSINQFKNEEYIVFSIKDNGTGIDNKYFERIFGLFEKLDLTKEGTGVGLALVKRIIEIHKGKIWVESAGKLAGSTFFIAFPKNIIS